MNSPVKGYRELDAKSVALVNKFKVVEERILRELDALEREGNDGKYNLRWLAVGRTNLEQAFMAINRAIFKPERVKLEDN